MLRTPVQQGRYISDSDVEGAPLVVVLNEGAATRYFGGRSPLGAQIQVGEDRTVIGVVANTPVDGPAIAAAPTTYIPLAQANSIGGARSS